jgi:hypothetical protein
MPLLLLLILLLVILPLLMVLLLPLALPAVPAILVLQPLATMPAAAVAAAAAIGPLVQRQYTSLHLNFSDHWTLYESLTLPGEAARCELTGLRHLALTSTLH